MFKHFFIFSFLMLTGLGIVYCQNDNHPVNYQLVGKVTTQTELGIKELKDSSVVLLHRSPNKFNDYKEELIELQISNVDYLRVRTKRNVGKGALIGGAVGFFMGYALVGFGDNPGGTFTPSSHELGVGLGTLFGIGGAVIGGLTAKSHIKIPLSGNQKIYEKRKDELLPYLTN